MSGASQQQSAQDSKEREARDVHIKEEQLRERELQRQHMDQLPSHQTQSQNVHLHQPVAVGPRTVHGPNGLLGNPSVMNPSNPPHSHLPPHAGSGAVFGPGAVQPPQPAHPAHTVQTLQSGMLLPFAPAVQPQSANSAQGQQPILNVSHLFCFSPFLITKCLETEADMAATGRTKLPRPGQGAVCRSSRCLQQVSRHYEGFQERSVCVPSQY